MSETADARLPAGLPGGIPRRVITHPEVVAAHRASSLVMAGLGAAGVVTLLLGTLRRHNRITGTGLLLLYAALYMILLNAF